MGPHRPHHVPPRTLASPVQPPTGGPYSHRLHRHPEVTARLLDELDFLEGMLWITLHIDGRIEIEAPWKLPHHPSDPLADRWGVRYQKLDYGTGTYEEPCQVHYLSAQRRLA